MLSTLFSLTVVIVIFCAHHVARAQFTTNAVCSSDFDWAKDQQQRSPCLLAAYVYGTCTDSGIFNVPALSVDEHYILPNKLTECACSIAFYNTIMACSACQGASPIRFPYWIDNCTIAGLLDTTTYYPTSKRPIPDGVQIPLWAQEDARLWTNAIFNSTEARQIAASGILKGPPLTASSSTTSTTATSSSPSSTSSPASPNDNQTKTGAIVGSVVGGVLGLLLVGVLILWMTGYRRPSSPSTDSKGPTPALIDRVVPVPLRPPHPPYPSSMPSPTPTSNGTGHTENNSPIMVQHAPWTLGHPGSLPYPYGTTNISPTFTPPPMVSSSSVGRPSPEPQRMGGSPSMIAPFMFPHKQTKHNSDVPSTLSQGSSRMSQMETPSPNLGHFPPLTSSSPDPGPISGPSMLHPTPYIQRPVSQSSAPSSGGSTGYPRENYPPGYTSPEATTFPSTTFTAFQYQY